MLRSLLPILGFVAIVHALSPAQDGDIFVTKTVTSTHFVCPCDSTVNVNTWLTSPFGSLSHYSSYTSSIPFNVSPSGTVYSTSSISTSSISTTLTSTTSTNTGNIGSTTITTLTTSLSTTSTSSVTSTTSISGSTTSTTSAVPSFYFAAYGNGFVSDGTTLGDDTSVQYAALNNANTAFIVNSTGALIDSSNGNIAVVQRSSTNPIIMFVSQAQFDVQTTSVYATCNCAVSTSFLSCSCNGLTAFAAGADTYLHIKASTNAKRGDVQARQASVTAVSMSATPVPSSAGSTTTTTVTTTATTTSSCSTPAPTFLIIANGSNNEIIADGTFMIQRLSTSFDTGNGSYAQFSNNSDPFLYSLDPCTGYLRENRYGNVATIFSGTGRYRSITWQPANNASFFANATFCIGNIASTNALTLDCQNGYNKLETDSSGTLQIANVQPNSALGDYVVYPTVRMASAVPTFATYTASACASPTPTFNVVSNGSTYSDSITNKTSPYGTFMFNDPLPGEANKTAGSFSNETAAGVYTIDPCTGVWTERSSGRNQIATVVNFNRTATIMQWSDPGIVKPDYNAKVCKCSIDSATSNINCDCGFSRYLYALYGDRNWLYNYAPGGEIAGFSYIQPLARLLP